MKSFGTILKSFLIFVACFGLFNFVEAKKKIEPSLQLKGCIFIQADLKALPKFTVFFEGVQVKSDEDGFFPLAAKQSQINNASILICENFKTRFRKNDEKGSNTIDAQYLTSGVKYRYFTRHFDENEREVWEEEALENYEIPDDCVIVLMDPNLVESVEDWDVSLPAGIKKLAKINLKSDATEKELFESSSKSLLGVSIDVRNFYGAVTEITKKIDGANTVKISMVQ